MFAEPLQQALVWPSYHQPPSVLIPPLPPPPLQLLSSASSDYLASSTTLHQHTQTHSTRLLAVSTTADNKQLRKIPVPTTTFIKIETDATLDQCKTLQAVSTMASNTATVFTDQPLLTTHVIYQHPTNHLILSQPNEALYRTSQATSPGTLTPPPETTPVLMEETLVAASVQDASNQTDTLLCSEDDNTVQLCDKNDDLNDSASITAVPEEDVAVPDMPSLEISEEKDETPVMTKEEPIKVEETRPDLSGLELLSNSIVEYENGRQTKPSDDNEEKSTEDNKEEVTQSDALGGLDLLCALAEQRIMEETVESHQIEKKERKREKRKHKHENSSRKKKRYDDEKHEITCSCAHRSYKTPESAEEVKRFLASKSQNACCKGDWPCMNEMELDMRMKLADLQRQYREKRKELSKLKPKKHSSECSKKRKKSETQAPPPTLLPVVDVSVVEPVKPKLEAIKQSDRIINDYKNDLLRQQALEEIESSPEKNSSSKKRKVGRPTKRLLSSSRFHVRTETIVAKKPKNSFVGYLLAAKEKLQTQNFYNSPPRFLDEAAAVHTHTKKNKNNNIIIEEVKSKIRPKLKAEPTIKLYEDEDISSSDDELDENIEPPPSLPPSISPVVTVKTEEVESKKDEKIVDSRCTLTSEHLEIDKLRVLTAMGGLFYAGHLNAVEPPDVYSIILDGERGNRPHIMSREEILRDAVSFLLLLRYYP